VRNLPVPFDQSRLLDKCGEDYQSAPVHPVPNTCSPCSFVCDQQQKYYMVDCPRQATLMPPLLCVGPTHAMPSSPAQRKRIRADEL
jgi:hypothetical protein